MRNTGLERADDPAVWERGRAHGLMIMTKGDDFRRRSLHRAPLKVIWLRLGNGHTAEVAAFLTVRASAPHRLLADEAGNLLVLRPAAISANRGRRIPGSG
jgi:predicted nuclease of predicted toxin-antitoxin system